MTIYILSRTDLKSVPRCHLASGETPALSEILTYFRQLTYALRRRYSAAAFDCALHGPFNRLRSAGSQLIRLSVSARYVFTSTSSVYFI